MITKLRQQLIACALTDQKTGITLLDNAIADAKEESRMITEEERAELQRLYNRREEQ